MEDKRNVQIASTVAPDVYKRVEKLAKVENRSIASVLRRAIQRELTESCKTTQKLKSGKARRELAAA